MNATRRFVNRFMALSLASALACLWSAPSWAANRTWNGNTDANWNNPLNWNEGAVGSGNTPVFGAAGTSGTTLNNDTAALNSYAGITFNNLASSFVIGGSSITLSGNVTVGTGITSEALNFPIVLGATRTVTVNSGTLTFGGVVSQSVSSGLTVLGEGALRLTNVNSYAGANTVYRRGTLRLDGGAGGALSTSSTLWLGASSDYTGGGTFIYDNAGAAGATSQTLASLGSQISCPNDNAVQVIRSAAQPVSLIFTAVSGNNTENGNVINFVASDTAGGGVNGTDYKIVLAAQAVYNITVQNAYFNGGDFAVYDTSAGTGLLGFVRGIRYGVDAGSATSAGGASFPNTTNQEITGNITAQTTVTLGVNGNLGTLKINGPYNIAMANASQTMTFTGGGNVGIHGILKTGGGTSTISGGASVTLPLQADIRVDGPTDVLDIAMPVIFSGNCRYMKSGAGRLIFSSGTTTVKNYAHFLNGGTWEIGGNAVVVASGSGDLAIAPGALFRYNSSAASTYARIIKGGGGVTVSAGTLTLSGGNAFTGQLTVDGGTLSVATVNNVSASGPLGQSALPVILGKSAGGIGTLLYTGAGTSSTKPFTMASGGTGAFQVDTGGIVLTLNGAIDGSGGLAKTGNGTVTLGAVNTYNGATTISAGVLGLAATGSMNNTARIETMASSATFDVSLVAYHLLSGQELKGIGQVKGNVLADAGSRLTPGNSVGTLTFQNNLTLDPAATNYFELGSTNTPGTTYDQVVVTGTLNVNGVKLSGFNITTNAGCTPGVYHLFSAGTLSGVLGAPVTGDIGSGLTGTLYIEGSELLLRVHDLTPPPTPAAMGFAEAPAAIGPLSIKMASLTAVDDYSPPVEYYFLNTTNSNTSGWISDTNWTDSGLTPGTTYGYKVTARDAWSNETAYSDESTATTGVGGESDPPTPDPMQFSSPPSPVGAHAIAMTATNASDASPPVEYCFTNTVNGHARDWSTDASWTDTGLDPSQTYSYQVKARDSFSNETAYSTPPLSATTPNDVPPTPAQMAFFVAPTSAGPYSITMTAETASDVDGVEYYFAETSGNPGGSDSGWQESTNYTDTGLSPSTVYTYTVLARDKTVAHNTNGVSDPASATTFAPDLTPPDPNPMTFAVPPKSTGPDSITMTATTATDEFSGPVQYYFTCTAGGAADSGWQSGATYTLGGLTEGAVYSFTVKARDASASGPNTNTASAAMSAQPGSAAVIVIDYNTNTVNYTVGNTGDNNLLIVTNNGGIHGELINGFDGHIGRQAGADSNAVIVTGSGQLWSNAATLYVGNLGSFNSLTIADGARVQNVAGTIGQTDTADSNTVTVTGSGSVWSNSGQVVVGGELVAWSGGDYNRLIVTNGGSAFSAGAYVGQTRGCAGNCAFVTGASSIWSNTSTLTIGAGDANNNLTIADGGKVYVAGGNFDVGTYSGASGNNNAVLVTGSNSQLIVSGNGNIQRGPGNTVTVNDRGYASFATLIFGNTGGGQDNLTVASSGMVSCASFTFAQAEGGSTMIVSNGATMNNGGNATLSAAGYSNNRYFVDGGGSIWSNSAVTLSGKNSTVDVRNGGVMLCTSFSMGAGAAGDTNNGVLVAGGGLLQAGASITVGRADNASNTLTNQGAVLQFTSGAPTVTIGAGAGNGVMIDGGTLAYKGASGVDMLANTMASGIGLFAWSGANTLRLDNATATGVAAYSFGVAGSPRNYVALELFNSATLANAITIDGANGGTLLVSNATVSVVSGVTLAGIAPVTALGTNSLTGAIEGPGSLTKLGAGTLTLNSANTYDGVTTVSAGTLALGAGGSIASTPLIDLSSGAATLDVSAAGFALQDGQELKGIGAVTGSVAMASGSALTPGNSVGTLTFQDSLTLAAGTTNSFELGTNTTAGTDYDHVVVAGTLAVSGVGWDDFAFSTLPGFGEGVYVLIDAHGLSGSLGANTNGGMGSLVGTLSLDAANHDLLLTVTAINDVTAPTPDPMGFSALPAATGPYSIAMTASNATDNAGGVGGVQYFFTNTVNGGVSGWQDGRSYTNAGLLAGTSYAYMVRARDGLGNETGWSDPASATTPAADLTPPTPSPMSFAVVPAASGESSITMTATPASDVSGVEYYFAETSGNPGGSDSGWQDSPAYTDTGLNPSTLYTYTVRARDKSADHNETVASGPASATTTAPDTTAPVPDPMTFAVPPASASASSITMTAAAAGDPNGVEYWFACTAGPGGHSSLVWQDSPVYTDVGLTEGATYTYTVKARDKSAAQNQTAPSAGASAEPGGGVVTIIDYYTNAAAYTVGNAGDNNLLIVTNNGAIDNGELMNSGSGVIGALAGSDSNTVIVTGAGQVWSNSANFYIGNSGSVNRLTIADGARVYDAAGTIGNSATANSNAVTVTGSGSVWSNSGLLIVGYAASNLGSDYNSLTITNGGAVISAGGYVGRDRDASHNRVIVTGSGSIWTNTATVDVGRGGVSNSLTISDGGKVYVNGTLTVAQYQAFSYGHSIRVAGADAALIVNGALSYPRMEYNSLTVSESGTVSCTSFTFAGMEGNNTMHVSGGAAMNNSGAASLSGGGQAGNNHYTVDGAGTVWTNASVALNSRNCTLNVGNGAQFMAATFSVGAGSASDTNNRVLLSGGSLLQAGASITVGRADNQANTVTNQGGILQFTSAAPTVTIGAGAGNRVAIDGGTLSYKGAAGVNMNANAGGAGTVGAFAWTGTNAFRLDGSTETGAGTYTFANNLGAQNYAALELLGVSSIGRAIALDGGNGGSMLLSGATATISGGVTLIGEATLTAQGAASSLAAAITGGGTLVKAGAGTLTLASVNNYTGDTKVQAGALGLLNACLDAGADLYLTTGATCNLGFGGMNTIRSLYVDSELQASGTWGAFGSGAQHESAFFTGGGMLNVAAGLRSSGGTVFKFK